MCFFRKKSVLGLLAFAGCLVMSCSKDNNDNSYTGENKTYFTSQSGTTALVEGEVPEKLTIKLTLTKSVTAHTVANLKVTDTEGNVTDLVRITPERLEFQAGSREATFEVAIKEKASILQQTRIKINIAPQEHLTVGDDFYITLQPSPTISDLTDAQKKLIEGYKAKGMDIAPFLGKLNVKGTIYSAKDGSTRYFTNAFERTIDGISVITLSEQATADTPVLKMTENPMGATAFFYEVLRYETIENDEYFTNPDGAPFNKLVMELIKWNKDSQETFSATLDGIKVGIPQNNTASLECVQNYNNVHKGELNIVPFVFKYSAWDRLQKLINEGNQEAIKYHEGGSTPDPDFYLNNTDILTDEYGSGAFVLTKGSIDFVKRTMNFTFLASHESGGDYLKFEIEYSVK